MAKIENLVAVPAYSQHDVNLAAGLGEHNLAVMCGLAWKIRVVRVDFDIISGMLLAVYALSSPRKPTLH